MTARQRAQVVELLRCCFDACQFQRNGGVYGTARDLGHPTWDEVTDFDRIDHAVVFLTARTARMDIEAWFPWVMSYEDTCLEAALRVEEGWNP